MEDALTRLQLNAGNHLNTKGKRKCINMNLCSYMIEVLGIGRDPSLNVIKLSTEVVSLSVVEDFSRLINRK